VTAMPLAPGRLLFRQPRRSFLSNPFSANSLRPNSFSAVWSPAHRLRLRRSVRETTGLGANHRCRDGGQASDASHLFCLKELEMSRKILFAALPLLAGGATGVAFSATSGSGVPVAEMKVGPEANLQQVAFSHPHGGFGHGDGYGYGHGYGHGYGYGGYHGYYDYHS